jgi:hypothetical protein
MNVVRSRCYTAVKWACLDVTCMASHLVTIGPSTRLDLARP